MWSSCGFTVHHLWTRRTATASTDGYRQTYTVDARTVVDRGNDTIGKVAKGNDVTVIATVSGTTATASTIEDSSIDSRSARAAQDHPAARAATDHMPVTRASRTASEITRSPSRSTIRNS
jgi:hypothetical protein